jgi:hypothetical protein
MSGQIAAGIETIIIVQYALPCIFDNSAARAQIISDKEEKPTMIPTENACA